MSTNYITPAQAGVTVGDYFVCSWGYDQTNIDFYKVVGLTAKGIKVQPWQSALVGASGGPQEYVIPGDAPKTEMDWSAVTPDMGYWDRQAAIVERPKPIKQKRIQRYGTERPWFTVNSYSNAYLWEGGRACQTGPGWGH